MGLVQADRQRDRQVYPGRQTDRQTNRQTDRQTDRKTNAQTENKSELQNKSGPDPPKPNRLSKATHTSAASMLRWFVNAENKVASISIFRTCTTTSEGRPS